MFCSPVQLVFLDLESLVEDLLCLGSSHGAVDGDLLVTADSERSHGVLGLREHRGLTGQLLEHLNNE